MAKITKEQALALAGNFRDTSVELGDYRFANWTTLTPIQRQALEDEEWTLLNYSSDLITKAVGIALDDAKFGLKDLMKAVQGAADVISNIKLAKSVIELAGALVTLGAAIASENPGAIASAGGNVLSLVQKMSGGNAS